MVSTWVISWECWPRRLKLSSSGTRNRYLCFTYKRSLLTYNMRTNWINLFFPSAFCLLQMCCSLNIVQILFGQDIMCFPDLCSKEGACCSSAVWDKCGTLFPSMLGCSWHVCVGSAIVLRMRGEQHKELQGSYRECGVRCWRSDKKSVHFYAVSFTTTHQYMHESVRNPSVCLLCSKYRFEIAYTITDFPKRCFSS